MTNEQVGARLAAMLAERIQAIEFDHVFTLMPDGSILHPRGGKAYAPGFYESAEGAAPTRDDPEWSLVTHGMSGQYGYGGPVMHPSEYVGMGMAEHLLSLCDDGPAVFAVVVVEDIDGSDEPNGWAIARWEPRHISYPHQPGQMVECSACEIHCVCDDGSCVAHAADNPVVPGGIPHRSSTD